jgi:hypothetical protein
MNSKLQSSLAWFASATGTVVPAWGFFKNWAPPLFPVIGILLAPMSAALIYFVSQQRTAGSKLLRIGMTLLGLGIVQIIAYVVLLPQWAVMDPAENHWYQVGFGLSDWSLTDVGRFDKARVPDATAGHLMLIEAAFSPDGPKKIWKPWSIAAAGTVLLLLFVGGFIFWTSGFACLAKHKSSVQANASPNDD